MLMSLSQSAELTPVQIRLLENLLAAGFQFVNMERITRHLLVEKSGFIALLDPAEGQLRLFGQVGYRMGDGIGMLIEQGGRPAFVWKKESVAASSELLAAYERVKIELTEIVKGS
jgi:hypothetical protein